MNKNATICSPLCALAANHDNTGAGGAQRLKIPIAILPYDCEAIIVQQRRKLLREGVAHGDAGDPGLFLLARTPAPVGRPVQDLSDMIVDLCPRYAHDAPAAVDVARPTRFLLAGFEVGPELAVATRCIGAPARIASFEGKQAIVVQMRAYALQQRLLIGARQKCLKGVTGQ